MDLGHLPDLDRLLRAPFLLMLLIRHKSSCFVERCRVRRAYTRRNPS
jgi:hypothetical protein